MARTRHDVLTAALRVLIEEGQQSVTHANLARIAGYAKPTLYKHWPTRHDLIREALTQVGEVEHHRPSGNLREDLINEVGVFRREMELHQLHRALVVLVSLLETMPELSAVRDKLVGDGERVVRELLAPYLRGPDLDAAVLMLVGGVLQDALMHGHLPGDEVIAASVDFVLGRIELSAKPSTGRSIQH